MKKIIEKDSEDILAEKKIKEIERKKLFDMLIRKNIRQLVKYLFINLFI